MKIRLAQHPLLVGFGMYAIGPRSAKADIAFMAKIGPEADRQLLQKTRRRSLICCDCGIRQRNLIAENAASLGPSDVGILRCFNDYSGWMPKCPLPHGPAWRKGG
jgi:hypothetical protein